VLALLPEMAVFVPYSRLLLALCALALPGLASACKSQMRSGDRAAQVPDAGRALPRAISLCPAAARGSGITVELEPSRTSGVAPLSVFFDAARTSAAPALLPTARPFHDLHYCWDFGEAAGNPGGGHFATTGMPKNHAFGPVAAHVYETPGTFTARLSVLDRAARVVAQRSVTITVTDPERVFAGASTVCFANGERFDGCPAGARRVTTSLLSRVREELATGRRLLLQRGSTFRADAALELRNVPGPGLIGAFGPGADRPSIQTAIDTLLTNNARDFRFVDLHFEGQADTSEAISMWSRSVDLLVLRVSTHRIGAGINSGTGPEQLDQLPNGLTIQECEQRQRWPGGSENAEVGYFSNVSSHRFAMLGNVYSEINSDVRRYPLRVPWVVGAAISENAFITGSINVVNIHGPMQNDRSVPDSARPYTERLVFSGNRLDPVASPTDWTLAVGPSYHGADEGVRDLIFERNLILHGPRTAVGIELQSVTDVTIRNNVISNGNGGDCVVIDRGGRTVDGTTGGAPDFRRAERLSIVHNTCYGRGNEGEGMRLLRLTKGDAPFTRVHNNLVVGSSSAGQTVSYPDQMSLLAASSGNLLTAAPGFASSSPTKWEHFRLTAASAAIGAADAAERTLWDFESKPRDDAPDVGAFEFSAGE